MSWCSTGRLRPSRGRRTLASFSVSMTGKRAWFGAPESSCSQSSRPRFGISAFARARPGWY
ncbi:unnamed protein product [Symbiodinium sp. CCMP2592]|nr:unnamed protein product [Symbiodinium sp. CCMP2592]